MHLQRQPVPVHARLPACSSACCCRRSSRALKHRFMCRKMGEALSDTFEKKWQATGIEAKWAEEEHRQLMEQAVRPACLCLCASMPPGGLASVQHSPCAC